MAKRNMIEKARPIRSAAESPEMEANVNADTVSMGIALMEV